MPSTVNALFHAAGVARRGAVRWGERVPSNAPGVYVVARSADPAALSSQLAAVDQSAVQLLLDTRPGLTVDGARPSLEALCDRLKSMWLPDESVIYVGLAGTSLQTRVSQFYRTRLGARSPHAGGWPIKCIGDLSATWVHFGECDKVRDTETDILGAFMSEVTPDARASVLDPGLPLPFANLEFRDSAKRRHVKLHGIKGATASRMSGYASVVENTGRLSEKTRQILHSL